MKQETAYTIGLLLGYLLIWAGSVVGTTWLIAWTVCTAYPGACGL